MSNNSVRQILEARLNTEWAGRTPIYWDDINDRPQVGVPFIRCTLDGIDSENISIGCQRDYDLFVIQVFTPKGAGTESNFLLCDALTTMFRGYADQQLLCTKVVNERVGKSNEWYQRNVVIDTQYESYFL